MRNIQDHAVPPPTAKTKRLQILPFDERWSTLRMRATHKGMGNFENPGEGEALQANQWLHKEPHWLTMTQGFWSSLGSPLKAIYPQNWEGCFHAWDIKWIGPNRLCWWQQVSKSTNQTNGNLPSFTEWHHSQVILWTTMTYDYLGFFHPSHVRVVVQCRYNVVDVRNHDVLSCIWNWWELLTWLSSSPKINS